MKVSGWVKGEYMFRIQTRPFKQEQTQPVTYDPISGPRVTRVKPQRFTAPKKKRRSVREQGTASFTCQGKTERNNRRAFTGKRRELGRLEILRKNLIRKLLLFVDDEGSVLELDGVVTRFESVRSQSGTSERVKEAQAQWTSSTYRPWGSHEMVSFSSSLHRISMSC